ncbi:MAG: CHAT domain-containing protein, partial [Cyanobacteria bacterium J06632_3]
GDYQQSNDTYREYYQTQAILKREQIAAYSESDIAALYTADEDENRLLDIILQDESDFASLSESSIDDFQFFLKSASSVANPTDYLPLVAYNYHALGNYEAVFQLTEAIEQQTKRYQPLTDELSVSTVFKGGGSTNLVVRAFTLGSVGLHAEALELSLQVLEKDNSSPDSSSGPNVLLVVGQSYYELGNLTKASDTYQQMLLSAMQVGDRWSEAYAYSRLAEILADQNQPELAIAFYKKSVNTRESIRSSNAELSPELRLSFVETIAEDYRSLAGLLLQQDRVFEAQEVLDLLRVQELDDYLRTVRANDPVDGILDYWGAETAILDSYTEARGSTISLNDFAKLPAVQSNVQTLQRTASTQVLNPGSLEKLRDNLESLDQAALLYPLVLEDRLEIILVTPDELIRKTVSVSEQTLNQEISQFRKDLINVSSNPAISGNKLYQRLIAPLEAELAAENIETLLYAADSQLRYVPLSALHTGSQWVAQQYNVNQITAASLTDFSDADSDNLSVLAGAFSEGEYSFDINGSRFSFSGLPYAGKEVEAIDQELSNSQAFFNQQFSPSNILPKMANYGVVHFATHAAFLPGSPNESFILFGNGDRVNLRDIADWNLPDVDLVVLSACQTAVSEDFGSGKEILGFGYQMQKTGARAAIASLWQVDDGGTQVLMNAFYIALENGFSKAEALQRAQQALINNDLSLVGGTGTPRAGIDISGGNNTRSSSALSGRSDHPYYWAPFILIGNGL